MKHLVIRNLGPLRSVDINIGKVNLIIGLQSSGKSCVLKTACYCAWVEKRIELNQSAEAFANGSAFIDGMLAYYKMKSYAADDTYIEYQTPYMKFSYSHKEKVFSFSWGERHWDYRKAKISYVPSDRNLVAAIPAWSKLSLNYDNLLDFMDDWNVARRFSADSGKILNLGIAYDYDAAQNVDHVKLQNGKRLRLTEGSSGIQSLVPLFVHLNYLSNGLYKDDSHPVFSYEEKEARRTLLSTIYRNVNAGQCSAGADGVVSKVVDGMDFTFSNSKLADEFERLTRNFLNYDHNEIFLEEPEDNLFPTTQSQLVDWLLYSALNEKRADMLFVATHSPYILNEFLKDGAEELNVFLTSPVASAEGMYDVRCLTREECSDVYANGVDLFFNFESYS